MARRLINPEPEYEERPEPVQIRFDTVNEQIVIAACFVSQSIRHGLVRRFKDNVPFIEKIHQDLWIAIVAMCDRSLEFDPATVQTYTDAACAEYAAELVGARPDIPPNLEHHVKELEWSAKRYMVVSGPLAELIAGIKDPHVSRDKVADHAKTLYTSLYKDDDNESFYDTTSIALEQARDIADRMRGRAVYPYGLDGFDFDENNDARMIPGMAPKRITLVTGVSGSGKSTIANIIILKQIELYQRTVCIGAWEMSPGTTLEVLAILKLRLSRTKVSTGALTPVEYNRITKTMKELGKYIKFVKIPKLLEASPRNRRTNIGNIDRILDAVEEKGCDIFMADLLRKAFVNYDPEEEEKALNHFQDRMEKSNLHSMILQQQRMKDVEQRPDKRPTREGVKGTSAWVEVSDTVLGVHKEAQWKNIEETSLELDVLKQRYAKWPIAVVFPWNPEFSSLGTGRTATYDLSLSSDGAHGGGVKAVFRGVRNKRKKEAPKKEESDGSEC